MRHTVEIVIPRGTQRVAFACGGCGGRVVHRGDDLQALAFGQGSTVRHWCLECAEPTEARIRCSAVADEVEIERASSQDDTPSGVQREATAWTYLREKVRPWRSRNLAEAMGRDLEAWDELLHEDETTTLVGDCNRILGVCDDCTLDGDPPVVAYRSWLPTTIDGGEEGA